MGGALSVSHQLANSLCILHHQLRLGSFCQHSLDINILTREGAPSAFYAGGEGGSGALALAAATGGGASRQPGFNSGVISPILGVHMPSPVEEELFVTEFSTSNLVFLGDHVLHYVVVVPGAAYISMTLSAMVEMHGHSRPIKLEQVQFPQAMVLPRAETGRAVQLVFESGDDESGFGLHSLQETDPDDPDDDDEEWTMHIEGIANCAPTDAPPPRLPGGFEGYMAPVRATCTEDLSKKVFYERMWEREYHLGLGL